MREVRKPQFAPTATGEKRKRSFSVVLRKERDVPIVIATENVADVWR